MSGYATIRWLALLTGARVSSAERVGAAMARLDAIAWDRVMSAVVAERLSPTVFCHLRDLDLLSALPEAWRDSLQDAYRLNQALYIEQASAMSLLADALDSEDISFRLLKGMAVAARAYSIPTARAVGDVDLWVQPRDLARTERVLLRLGLVRDPASYSLPYMRTFLGEQTFSRPDPQDGGERAPAPANVDLHSHLLKPWWLRETLRVDESAIFARTQGVSIAGRSYPTLDPTDTIHYLCLHAKGGYHIQPWRCLLDIQLLAAHGSVDWDRLNASAGAWGTRTALWRVFTLIDWACGTRHVEHLEQRPPAWHRRVISTYLPPPPPGAPPLYAGEGESRLPVADLVLLPDTGAMLRATLRLAWPSARWLRLRYNLPGGERLSLVRARWRYVARFRRLFRTWINRALP